jgi:hypothetical protein
MGQQSMFTFVVPEGTKPGELDRVFSRYRGDEGSPWVGPIVPRSNFQNKHQRSVHTVQPRDNHCQEKDLPAGQWMAPGVAEVDCQDKYDR